MSIDSKELLETLRYLHAVTEESVTFYDCENLEADEETSEADLLSYMEGIIDDGNISIFFPGEGDNLTWKVEDFFKQANECRSLSVSSNGQPRSASLAFQLVDPVSMMAHKALYFEENLKVKNPDGVTIKLTNRSIPVGLHAINVGAFHWDYSSSLTSHLVIEVDYSDSTVKRTDTLDSELIDAYLFELAASHDIVLRKDDFKEFVDDPWYEEEEFSLTLRPLENTNEGMQLFLAASQILDPPLRFFSFFKVLEYFAPVVLNLEAHDCLRKKLESPSALCPDGAFIKEVFQISKNFDMRKQDRDLIKGVLCTGTDLVGISKLLPEVYRGNLTYDSNQKDIENHARNTADAICATRNEVAHAKANYTSRGCEIGIDDLPEFNRFMMAASAEVIRWYNRLPKHQKTDLSD